MVTLQFDEVTSGQDNLVVQRERVFSPAFEAITGQKTAGIDAVGYDFDARGLSPQADCELAQTLGNGDEPGGAAEGYAHGIPPETEVGM